MNATRDRLVDAYLARLDGALAGVPADRRREIVEDVAAHIDAARVDLAPDDEAGLRSLLERVGDPEQIAADALGDVPPRRGRGRQETAAIVLLLVGGFLLAVGWLVGAVMLWLSDRWRIRDKVIGTLFVPGGLAAPFVLLGMGGQASGELCTGVAGTAQHCRHYGGMSTWHHAAWIVLFAALTAAPIAAAVHLARRSR